jgi:hypothetical protein
MKIPEFRAKPVLFTYWRLPTGKPANEYFSTLRDGVREETTYSALHAGGSLERSRCRALRFLHATLRIEKDDLLQA